MKREGDEVKFQVKHSIYHNNGKGHDYKASDDHCQAVTIANKPLTPEIFENFTKPYQIPGLPQIDDKEVEYSELMNVI